MAFLIETNEIVSATQLFAPTDSLIESFIAPDGSFQSSTCQDPVQQIQIGFQRHVDIRIFQQNDIHIPLTMFDLDLLPMSVLDTYTMLELDDGIFIASPGEHWTLGTVGVQSDRANQYGIQLSCTTGANVTSSVSLPVDIGTGFTDNDFISLACPNFPLSGVDLTQCFLDLTSDPLGSFADDTVSVAFSRSTIAPVAGDSEIRFKRSYFTNVDLDFTNITGVRIRIQANEVCTFRCMAIRLFPATWANAPVDLDTRRRACKLPVTRNGSTPIAAHRDFPTSTMPPSDETDFPILFRSLPGTSNPIDIKHTTFIFTGLMAETGGNFVDVLYRATAASAVTMLDLDGLSMSTMDGQAQPDFSTNSDLLVPETVSGLDGISMAKLDLRDMSQMDGTPTSSTEDYLKVHLAWGVSGTTLTIQGKSGDSYEFFPHLLPNTYYVMYTALVDDGIQCIMYEASAVGIPDFTTEILNTTVIVDPTIIHLRRGRIGWYARFSDGDALLLDLTSRYTNFGEYNSNVFNSMTPVSGARIFPETTGDRQLASQLYNGLFGGTVVSQPLGWSVQNIGTVQSGGAQTAPFWVYDWENLVIEFDLLFPSSGAAHPLDVFLLNRDHTVVPLPLPTYNFDHWQHYRLQPIVSPALPYQDQAPIIGYFSLQLLQPGYNNDTWFLKNLSVTGRSFRWRARSDGPDLWGDDGEDWVYFDVIDTVNDGAIFNNRGTALQVSGVQMNPAASIDSLQIIPRYASPGKLVWYDEAPPDGGGPTAAFTVTESF